MCSYQSRMILVKPTNPKMCCAFSHYLTPVPRAVWWSQADTCLHLIHSSPANFSFIITAPICFVLLLLTFIFFPGSQGKPDTQIPQRGSEAQWSTTDYAQVSQLLGQIPMLRSIHVTTGCFASEIPSLSTPLVGEREQLFFQDCSVLTPVLGSIVVLSS